MAGPWDIIMKRLVKTNPQDFVRWLEATAIFLRALDIELKSQHTFADALLEILLAGKQVLLHLEFQTDKQAGIRTGVVQKEV